MKVLTLQIKRHFLEQILSGEKTDEFRDILPKNEKKYCKIVLHEDDNTYEVTEVVKYDAIRFFNGYKTDRPEVLIEIKNAFVDFEVDEEGVIEWEMEDGTIYPICCMVYQLGKVLERKNI
ncbi:hypothetical protein [Riemerella columbipharyngis]|uniref:ASCH domain-containing protein n=1 Tax=Riemerella columbipharyngis TaxID=1071918 RepID=A0A1G7ANC7_9FLAO|nr:hypothetical protein [Riemerella columbipharyngis]SDE15967.1 hypothetical protein SAMN05421544_10432 [Riemerella columbipharyngis]